MVYNIDTQVYVCIAHSLYQSYLQYCNMSFVFFYRSVWSRDGCTVNSSTPEVTVCECNHLTHFAVMLSPKDSVSVLHVYFLGTNSGRRGVVHH